MDAKVTREKLEKLNLFNSLPAEALEELAAQCRLVHVAAGDYLFKQDDMATTIYLVESGAVQIIRRYDDGEHLTLETVMPGHLIGELSTISHQPRLASGVAKEDTVLIALDSDIFFQYLDTHPSIALEILVQLSRRLRKLNLQVREIAAHNTPARIASLLLFLAEKDDGTFRTGLISTNFSLERIARALSLDTDYLRKVLREWEEEGFIGLDGRRFLLHDPEELQEIAGW
ncbi:MAG: hypothetical protein CUN55_01430 [Phototrophicales bacterium]|nr:MAG: hypothetical protein CUN55_01430 [Phototrophicales bacterium]